MAIKLQDCYKVIISCLYDFENWTGEDAKYITECTQSSAEDYILYDYTDVESYKYYYGGPDKYAEIVDSTDCSPGKLSFFPVPGLSGTKLQTTILGNLIGWMSRGNNSSEFSLF